MKAFAHFCTITKHKKLVLKECFRVGLYKQGLLHDMSKYSWTEFRVGCRYYQGTRSPNNAEREEKGYSSAWLHHKGRNRHHFEYWTDYSYVTKKLEPVRMPDVYIYEMFCDRVAASKIYNKENYNESMPLEYFLRAKHRRIIEEYTAKKLEFLLRMLKDRGEEATFAYMRKHRPGHSRRTGLFAVALLDKIR